MWRYRELMPLLPGDEPVTLGEGFTPLIHARRLGGDARARAPVHQGRVAEPDQLVQGARPVGGDHPRQGARRRNDCASRPPAMPATPPPPMRPPPVWPARCSSRRTRSNPSSMNAACTGREVTLVDGLITDAGRIAAETGKPLGWYDVSTLKEPYRIEGKKTMGFELAEQLGWTLPDWIVYPTGGGTGLVGMWKAFDEIEAIGWIAPAAAADGLGAGGRLRADRACVRRGREEGDPVGERAHRRRRPARAARHRRLSDPSRRVRESRGTAVAVSDARDGARHAGDRQARRRLAPRPKAAPR